MVISKLINIYLIIYMSIVTSRLDWNHFSVVLTSLERQKHMDPMGQIAARRGPKETK